MSDTTRPLGDFSQKNSAYGEVPVTSLNGAPLKEAVSPSSLFSSKPLPGTFASAKTPSVRFGGEILNPRQEKLNLEKMEVEMKKEGLEKKLYQTLGGLSVVFQTINSPELLDIKGALDKSSSEEFLRSEIEELALELAAAVSLEQIFQVEKKVSEVENKIHKLQHQISEVQLMRANNLSLLTGCIGKFAVQKDRALSLLQKTVPKEAVLKIEELLSSLKWLHDDPASGGDDSLEEIEVKINHLKEIVEEEEARISEEARRASEEETGKENAKKEEEKQETLSLYKELLPLIETLGHLKNDTANLVAKISDDTKKKDLVDSLQALEAMKDNLKSAPTTKGLGEFKERLEEYALITQETEAALESGPTAPLNFADGWPEDRFIKRPGNPKTGELPYWVIIMGQDTPSLSDKDKEKNGLYRKMSPVETSAWIKERENFNTVFNSYKKFLETDGDEKIKRFPKLILAKMTAVEEGIESGDIAYAAHYREEFRKALADAKDTWYKEKERNKELTKLAAENENVRKSQLEVFNSLSKKRAALSELYADIIRQIHSEDERKMLDRYFQGLQAQSEQLTTELESEAKPVEESTLENFKRGVLEFEKILSEIKARLEKVAGYRPILRSKVRPVGAKGGPGATAEDEQQAPEVVELSEEEKREVALFNELKARHKARHAEMLKKDWREYIKVYGHKKWLAWQKAEKAASESLLTEYVDGIFNDKKWFEESILELTAKADAAASEEEVNALNTSIQSRKYTLETINDQIREINEISRNERERDHEAKFVTRNTLQNKRQLYSPEKQARTQTQKSLRSIDDTEAKLTIRDEILKTDAEQTPPAESIPVQKLNPEQIAGMTNPGEDATQNEEAFIARAHATENPKVAVFEDEKPFEEGEVIADNPEKVLPHKENSLEENKKRTRIVNMAHQALSVMRSSVGHDNLKYWIAAVAALGAAGLISSRIPDNEPGVVSKPRTAEQSVSWRSVERGEEFKNFVEDLAGKNQLTYFDLLKKEIPSYPLDKNNPSTLVALSAMKCLELLTSQETVYGLNSEQRNETCLFVRKLEGVIQATEAPLVKRADYSQHPYAYADTNITVEKFYGVVRAAIVQADIREQKYII